MIDMKKIKLWILDDEPVKSGLEKLATLSFFTEEGVFDEEEHYQSNLAKTHDAKGLEFGILDPDELYAKNPEELENTIIMVDVNWEMSANIPALQDLSPDQKTYYGIEIAEWILDRRNEAGLENCYMVFFSNSQQETAQEYIDTWGRQGKQKIIDVCVGSGKYNTPERLVTFAWNAFLNITKSILSHLPSSVANELFQASIALNHSNKTFNMSELLGDHEDLRVDEYRLIDLLTPFHTKYTLDAYTGDLNEDERLQISKNIVQQWQDALDISILNIPPFEANSRRNCILQNILRYGKLDFVDMYLFGQDLDEVEMNNPKVFLRNRVDEQGMIKSELFKYLKYPFNEIFSKQLGNSMDEIIEERDAAVRHKKISNSGIPSILFDRDILDVERPNKKTNTSALLYIRRGPMRPAAYFELEISPLVIVNCPYIKSLKAVLQYQDTQRFGDYLWEAFSEDPENLQLLDILCQYCQKHPNGSGSSEQEMLLAQKLKFWHGRLKKASKILQEAQEQCLDLIEKNPGNDRLGKWDRELSNTQEKLNYWKYLEDSFATTGKGILGEDEFQVSDFKKNLFKLGFGKELEV